jgi:hypothetical protein
MWRFPTFSDKEGEMAKDLTLSPEFGGEGRVRGKGYSDSNY